MRRERKRLTQVLRQIAHDAGLALLSRSNPEQIQFCVAQYNRVRDRLAVLDPDVAVVFAPLPETASAGQVRIAARALAYHGRAHPHEERLGLSACLDALAACFSGLFLKFELT